MTSPKYQTAIQLRAACRSGQFTGQTSGSAPGFVQANLVILPEQHADDFKRFCELNPQPCPLLDQTEPGNPVPKLLAPSADLRTDLPRYRVWKNGKLVDEPTDITSVWQTDFVAFLLGCSFTFESALQRENIPVRHIELGQNVPMYRTSIACQPSGPFTGPLVVSMRPMNPNQAQRAVEITSRFPGMHGAPIQVGSPEQIGITNLSEPDYGVAVPINDDEIPVFWACGVTPQAVLQQAKLPLVITHSPGFMFVSDKRDEDYEV